MINQQIEEVLAVAKVKPACLQVESHPQLPNLALLEFCKKNGIAFVAYSPLGRLFNWCSISATRNTSHVYM